MSFHVVSFFSALIFGLGLGIAGMTLPAKIIGFLDVTGRWDPSLAFVMVGAISVHSVAYWFIMRRKSPLYAPKFQVPIIRKIEWKVIFGSLIFGAGWGLGGFCPGPAIVATVSGAPTVLVFLVSMIVGIYLYRFFEKTILSKVS